MKRIYLDYAATTPVDPEVIKAMTPFWNQKFGNASSIHSFGREARLAVDETRRVLASFLDCQPNEIVFTSGGSESDNLAIRGLIANIQHQTSNTKIKLHVITTQIEHHAVLSTIKDLEKQGTIEATYLKPDEEGIVSPEQVKAAIQDNTVLVSIMYVNNEIGTVQPIREIGKALEKINQERDTHRNNTQKGHRNDSSEAMKQWNNHIYFHTDAVQAAEYFEIGTKYLKVDLLTMTAHKIYGPKGVGLLFIKKGTPINCQVTGGEQEYRKRAGTENVAGIVGMGKAVELVANYRSNRQQSVRTKNSDSSQPIKSVSNNKIGKLRDKLIKGLLSSIPKSRLNGSLDKRSPANVSITIENAEGEALLLNLDLEGIAASSGSACTSGALEPSHVLLAIGVPAEKAHGSIRFTLGRQTTDEDIDKVLKIFPKIVKKVRSMSPFQTTE